MQSASFTGIDADKELDSTALGFDPADYSHFYIQVLGSETATFSIQTKAPGSSQYAVIHGLSSTTMSIPGTIAITHDHIATVGALKVVFSESPTAATILVAARNWRGTTER